jgi:hypothetical protein
MKWKNGNDTAKKASVSDFEQFLKITIETEDCVGSIQAPVVEEDN